jgi:hypothetical protein
MPDKPTSRPEEIEDYFDGNKNRQKEIEGYIADARYRESLHTNKDQGSQPPPLNRDVPNPEKPANEAERSGLRGVDAKVEVGSFGRGSYAGPYGGVITPSRLPEPEPSNSPSGRSSGVLQNLEERAIEEDIGQRDFALSDASFYIPGRPPISQQHVIAQTNILIAVLEQAVGYDEHKHHNRPPPELYVEFGLSKPEALTDLKELIAQLKRLNDLLEAATPDTAKLTGIRHHLDRFAESYMKTLGKGAGYLTMGAIVTLIYHLGGRDLIEELSRHVHIPD